MIARRLSESPRASRDDISPLPATRVGGRTRVRSGFRRDTFYPCCSLECHQRWPLFQPPTLKALEESCIFKETFRFIPIAMSERCFYFFTALVEPGQC